MKPIDDIYEGGNGNGKGVSWKAVATALAVVAWASLAGLTAWTLANVVALKVEVGKIETRLNMPQASALAPSDMTNFLTTQK